MHNEMLDWGFVIFPQLTRVKGGSITKAFKPKHTDTRCSQHSKPQPGSQPGLTLTSQRRCESGVGDASRPLPLLLCGPVANHTEPEGDALDACWGLTSCTWWLTTRSNLESGQSVLTSAATALPWKALTRLLAKTEAGVLVSPPLQRTFHAARWKCDLGEEWRCVT